MPQLSFRGLNRPVRSFDESIRSHYNFYGTASAFSDGHAFTSPVGSFAPNSWGCFDMHGNVLEWCQDYYEGDYYSNTPTDDPAGPESGTDRVFRSSSFMYYGDDSRSAHREGSEPQSSGSQLGFRIVLEVE